MTRYQIRVAITYDYDSPATGGRHLLRLMPRDMAGQEVSAASLVVAPRAPENTDHTDFFGNGVRSVALTDDHARISFTATAMVDRTGAGPGLDTSVPLPKLIEQVAALRDVGPESPLHFRISSPRIAPDDTVTQWARERAKGAPSVFAAVVAVGQALHDWMTFDATATTVDTPPSEAFRARHGVCQDFAQIMIAGLRGIGVPAGYVSGLLRTEPPPGRQRLEGADAMHAWVRAWCGEAMGWVEYDPTNACLVAQDHIVVAYGRDYGDVAPVAGILRIAGGQSTRQAVDVIPL